MTTREQLTAEALTEAYLEAFAASGLGPSKILEALLPCTVDTTYFGRCLSRPVFLSSQQIAGLGEDLERLHAALAGLPQRIFGGSMTAFARAVGRDLKGKGSIVLYAAGIAIAFLEPWGALALYVAVALIWLIPDRRIEKALAQ